MIYKDKELNIFRLKSTKGVNILKNISFETCDMYEICEFILCEQNKKYYVMGASRNINYYGYVINEKEKKMIDECEEKLVDLFKKYDFIYS